MVLDRVPERGSAFGMTLAAHVIHMDHLGNPNSAVRRGFDIRWLRANLPHAATDRGESDGQRFARSEQGQFFGKFRTLGLIHTVAALLASLASLSARSFSTWPSWPRTHCQASLASYAGCE